MTGRSARTATARDSLGPLLFGLSCRAADGGVDSLRIRRYLTELAN